MKGQAAMKTQQQKIQPENPLHVGSTCSHSSWVEMASGKQVDLINPAHNQIDINDIAHHLAGIIRFSGLTRNGIGSSVAAHSIWVADYLYQRTRCPLLAMHGLLHDAHEAYTGDITSPVKSVPGIREVLKPLCDNLQQVILDALHIPDLNEHQHAQVKSADMASLAVEAHYLMKSKGSNWPSVINADIEMDDLNMLLMNQPAGKERFIISFQWLNKQLSMH
jgi:uncharacterized protein